MSLYINSHYSEGFNKIPETGTITYVTNLHTDIVTKPKSTFQSISKHVAPYKFSFHFKVFMFYTFFSMYISQ